MRTTTTLRAIGLLLPILALASVCHGGDEEIDTLISEDADQGFYFAPAVRFTQIDGSSATLAGAQLSWIVDNRVSIGLAGYGVADDHRRLEFGYGGLVLEGIASPASVVHLAVRALVGGGWVESRWSHCGVRCGHGHFGDGEALFVAEPEVVIELNLASWIKIDVGGGYRYVSGSRLNSELRGGFGSVAVKLGWF